jgi:hypothetical protein
MVQRDCQKARSFSKGVSAKIVPSGGSMPEIEINKDKNPVDDKAHLTSQEPEKTNATKKPQETPSKTPPPKNAWDMPDGEFSEVIDSEGHRNRINHY